jgi:hypothetical protein
MCVKCRDGGVTNLKLKVLCKKWTSDNLRVEEITSVHMVSRNSVTQCASTAGNTVGEDDSDYRAEFFEWFQRKANGDEQFVDMTFWLVKATFNLSGTKNQHTVNPH